MLIVTTIERSARTAIGMTMLKIAMRSGASESEGTVIVSEREIAAIRNAGRKRGANAIVKLGRSGVSAKRRCSD
jgi:hypothetical protein